MDQSLEDQPQRTQDVLGISDPPKTERILLLDPKEDRWKRDPSHKLIARTYCEVVFDNEDDLQKCVAALRESDERLKQRPDEWLLWDWQATYREGMKIILGVNWYDLDFFRARKDAYKNPAHIQYLSRFGATPERLQIRHEVMTEVQ